MAAMVLTFCNSSELPKPSLSHPLSACYISCPWGYAFRRQHQCRSGTRDFTNITIVDEYVVRGSDGEKLSDSWVSRDGSLYDKQDVELGVCSSVIARIISLRDNNKRGSHPGEDSQGNPIGPPK